MIPTPAQIRELQRQAALAVIKDDPLPEPEECDRQLRELELRDQEGAA